jgi:hypothetical protein
MERARVVDRASARRTVSLDPPSNYLAVLIEFSAARQRCLDRGSSSTHSMLGPRAAHPH